MDAVRLTGVVKRFNRRYGAPTAQEHHSRGRQSAVDTALDGVDLVVEAGEAVGLLGPRRAGRTTLLSVINGVYEPDEGTAQVRGRVGGLVSMGAGFSPSSSVRSNIVLHGLLQGLTRDQVDERLEILLEDSGVPANLLPFPLRDVPAPRRQRLAYLLAMRCDPDVFLADKTVVTGDSDFRERGLQAIEAHRDAGRAVVLGTNDGRILRRICTRGVVLREGKIVFDGRIRRALQVHRGAPPE